MLKMATKMGCEEQKICPLKIDRGTVTQPKNESKRKPTLKNGM